MTWLTLTTMAAAEDLPEFSAHPIDADRFHPAMDSRLLLVQDAQPLTGRGLQLRALYTHASNPYVWVDRVTGEETEVVTSASTTVLGGSFWRGRARVGFDVPVHLSSTGLYGTERLGLGDARLEGRWSLMEGSDEAFGAALTGGVGFPLGEAERLLAPPGTWGEVGFATDYTVGRVLTAVELGFQFGPRAELHPDLTWDDQLQFGVGTAVRVHDRVDLGAELVGATQLDDFLGLGQGTPIEALLGTNIALGRDISLRIAGAAGLTDGIGAPDWRGVAGLSYRPVETRVDTDLDGIADHLDSCPQSAEDPDGFRDEDGCPDLDDDGDTLPDLSDACPREAEDIDGYEDGDGCPEGNATLLVRVVDWGGRPVRADVVRIVGAQDFENTSEIEVVLATGTFELEIEAAGHSPWFDTVEIPESGVVELDSELIGFGARGYVEVHALDDLGRPQRELIVLIDGDLRPVVVIDGNPQLELEPGAHELIFSAHGIFPLRAELEVVEDEQRTLEVTLYPELVHLTSDKLILDRRIEFISGTDEILETSKPVLDQVAATMIDHPEIKLLRVEGHTDSSGPDAMNLRLSQERADAVARGLRQRGVAPGRVYAVGFGEDFPVADNDTDGGKAKNRRVDFFIEERD